MCIVPSAMGWQLHSGYGCAADTRFAELRYYTRHRSYRSMPLFFVLKEQSTVLLGCSIEQAVTQPHDELRSSRGAA
jgi:hypothetical protein